MDIGGWLRRVGLGRYETVFRKHAIDMDVLTDLTDSELAQISVPLGDRKRLLKAIASLSKIGPRSSSKEGASPAEINLPATPTPVSLGAGKDFAERRPIAVMFCDLVGSSGLAVRLDAEDWRSLISAYLDAASEAATELGGHVLKKLGDGLMVLFGYPCAQENDAERAARAALAIQQALADLNMEDRRAERAGTCRPDRPRLRTGGDRRIRRGVRRGAQCRGARPDACRSRNDRCHGERPSAGRWAVRRRGQGGA